MSIAVMTMVFRAHFGSVSLKAVALKLADHAGDDGSSVYPAKASVAQATEVSVPTVKRALKLFVEKGLLRVVREGGRGPGDATEYAFDLDLLRSMCGGSTPLSAFPDRAPDADPVGPVEDHGDDAKGVTMNPLAIRKGGHGDPLIPATRGSPGDDKGVTGARKGGQALTPKPSRTINQPCSRARESASPPDDAQPDDDDLKLELMRAVGPAAAPGLMRRGSVAVIRKWLGKGADLRGDILPAVRERANSMERGSLRSWRFMDGPIGDWMRDCRGSGPPGPGPGDQAAVQAASRDPATVTPAQWRAWLTRWINGGAWFLGGDHPLPLEPGCPLPDDVKLWLIGQYGKDTIERRKAARRCG